MSSIPGNQWWEEYNSTPCSTLVRDLEKGIITTSLSGVERAAEWLTSGAQGAARHHAVCPGPFTLLVSWRTISRHQTFFTSSPSVLSDDNFVCYFTDEKKQSKKVFMCSWYIGTQRHLCPFWFLLLFIYSLCYLQKLASPFVHCIPFSFL